MSAGPGNVPFALSADEVHVWYVFSDDVTDANLLQRYAAMMSPDERARHDRFVFAKDRHRFLVTRGLVRTLIGDYAALKPEDCAFLANPFGRPSLRPGQANPTIEFNLSHTHGLVACAMARVPEIGLDVEDVTRRRTDHDIARRFFSTSEADMLDALPAHARASGFFDLWTLKEAYIKARGMGLALPLHGFSMHLDAAGSPRISFAETIDDDPATWQFAQFAPGPRHRLALAVRRRGPDLAIRFQEFVPP